MHARHQFHYGNNNLESALSKTETWIHENGSPNNWFETMLAINADDDATLVASDYRNLDERADELLAEYETYNGFHRWAWETTCREAFYSARRGFADREQRITDVEVALDKLDNLTLDQIPEWFTETYFETLRSDIAEIKTGEKETEESSVQDISRALKSASAIHDKVVRSRSGSNHPAPFGFGDLTHGRSFAIGGSSLEEQKDGTIVVADVHF